MLDDTLKERDSKYGDARSHFNCTKGMYERWINRSERIGIIFDKVERRRMLEHVVYMICDKLARASHDPTHLDNWEDIAGYATLMKRELEK